MSKGDKFYKKDVYTQFSEIARYLEKENDLCINFKTNKIVVKRNLHQLLNENFSIKLGKL